jgi:hypothetical protein
LEPPPPCEPVLWEPPPTAGAVPVCGDPPVAPVWDPVPAGVLPVLPLFELTLWVPLPVDRVGLVGVTAGAVWAGVGAPPASVT